VSGELSSLYDYDFVRALDEPSVFLGSVEVPTLVLGSSQSRELLKVDVAPYEIRRRRGGGGIVLLQPGDLWIDWWIPAFDTRWRDEARANALEIGQWWHQALSTVTPNPPTIVASDSRRRFSSSVACFAALGPGELERDGHKAVGITQWRVREGAFVSSVLPSRASDEIVALLEAPPTGLLASLRHHTLSSLGITRPEALRDTLLAVAGPFARRSHVVTP